MAVLLPASGYIKASDFVSVYGGGTGTQTPFTFSTYYGCASNIPTGPTQQLMNFAMFKGSSNVSQILTTGNGIEVLLSFTSFSQSAATYVATSYPGGITATGSASPITLSGLSVGSSYYFIITKTNSLGSKNSYPSLSYAVTSLYSFSGMTFTNAGAIDASGPTLSQCKTAYSTQSWTTNTNFFNMITQGIQIWYPPSTKSYTITIAGASGGSGITFANGNVAWPGGDGFKFTTTVSLTMGQAVYIVVGQAGQGTGNNANGANTGGGGASWIFDNNWAPIAVAGGGSGFQISNPGVQNQNGVLHTYSFYTQPPAAAGSVAPESAVIGQGGNAAYYVDPPSNGGAGSGGGGAIGSANMSGCTFTGGSAGTTIADGVTHVGYSGGFGGGGGSCGNNKDNPRTGGSGGGGGYYKFTLNGYNGNGGVGNYNNSTYSMAYTGAGGSSYASPATSGFSAQTINTTQQGFITIV